MSCINYCNDPLLEYTVESCGEYSNGGIESFVIFACGFEPVNPASGVEIQAIIDAGNAVKISGVKVGIPAASPITQDSPTSCGVSRTTNFDRTATIYDANLNATNNAFWNSANTNTFGAVLFFNCDANDAFYVNPPSGVSVQVSPLIPDTNTEFRRYEGQLSWRHINVPQLVAKAIIT